MNTKHLFIKCITIIAALSIISISMLKYKENKNEQLKNMYKPPYVVEDIIVNCTNDGLTICYLKLRPIEENYDKAFYQKVGKFTCSQYQLGDTVKNI